MSVSSSSWGLGRAAVCDCGTPWTFLLPFYKQKFRNCNKENEQTHVEFARTKEQLFDRWCFSKKIGSHHEKLRQLMLVEEFKRCINTDIKSFLDVKQVETLEAAARLADDYALTHKVSFINKSNPSRRPFLPQSGSKHSPSNPSGSYSQTFTPKPKSSGENKDQNPLSQPICNYCKKTGHIISECISVVSCCRVLIVVSSLLNFCVLGDVAR